MSSKAADNINYAVTAASAVSLVGKIPLIGGASFFAIVVSWFAALQAVGVHMWYTGIDQAVIYAAFIVGLLFALFVGYVLAFEAYKKDHDNALLQFDLKYVVAFLVSAIVSGAVAYTIIFYGIGHFYTADPLTDVFFVICICFAIGAISAYIVDALVFHPLMDGTVTILNNKAKKAILNKGLALTKDPATLAKIAEKAAALGLVDKTKVDKLSILVSGAEDPSFATYVQILKDQQ